MCTGGLKTSGGCPQHWIEDDSVLGNSSCAIPYSCASEAESIKQRGLWCYGTTFGTVAEFGGCTNVSSGCTHCHSDSDHLRVAHVWELWVG